MGNSESKGYQTQNDQDEVPDEVGHELDQQNDQEQVLDEAGHQMSQQKDQDDMPVETGYCQIDIQNDMDEVPVEAGCFQIDLQSDHKQLLVEDIKDDISHTTPNKDHDNDNEIKDRPNYDQEEPPVEAEYCQTVRHNDQEQLLVVDVKDEISHTTPTKDYQNSSGIEDQPNYDQEKLLVEAEYCHTDRHNDQERLLVEDGYDNNSHTTPNKDYQHDSGIEDQPNYDQDELLGETGYCHIYLQDDQVLFEDIKDDISHTTPNIIDNQKRRAKRDRRKIVDDSDDDDDEILEAALVVNRFGIKLYKAIKKEEPDEDENVFFSPLSLCRSLAIIHKGAQGSTAKQMGKIMKLSSLSDDAFKHLFSDLLANEDCQIKVASRLYGQKGLRFYLKYLASHSHGVPLETIDFLSGSKSTVQKIDDWVENQTSGKVQYMMESETLPTASRLILVDALYFHSEWMDGFDPSSTKELPFQVSYKNEITVPMMYREGIFHFYRDEDSDCKVLSIPYKGDQVTMVIALPDGINDLDDMEDDLDKAKLKSWREKMTKEKCQVTLPKFSLSESVSLVPYLKRMGLKDLFDAQESDLSGIAKEDSLCISDVFHKAVLTVDEKGGPVTGIATSNGNEDGEFAYTSTEVFKADHPFVVFVYDQATDAVILMGCVKCPSMA